jgi:hypothetical protein
MTEKDSQTVSTVKLPCGCIYQDKGWLLTRIIEYTHYGRKRASKRPYKPKAECVRPYTTKPKSIDKSYCFGFCRVLLSKDGLEVFLRLWPLK